VGAGDAFAAGWLAAHLRGFGPENRLDIANNMAAATLRSLSDVGQPPPDLVALVVEGQGRSS